MNLLINLQICYYIWRIDFPTTYENILRIFRTIYFRDTGKKCKLYDWLSLFNATKREEFSMIAERTPEIKKAVVIIEELSEDERTRLLAEAYEKKRRDDVSRIEGAVEERLEEERRQEKKKMVLALLKLNAEIEMIMEASELTREEIESLRNS